MIRQIAPTNGPVNGEETITLMMKRQPLEGSLEKKNKRLGWSRRKVTLEGDELVYSSRGNSRAETKSIPLKGINAVTCQGRILEINIGMKENDKKVELRAATEVDAFSWVQNLNQAIANAKAREKYHNKNDKKRVALIIDTSATEPELEFPLTPQSSFSIPSSGSFSGSYSPSLQRTASFDDQGDYVKKLWEKRTLQRRRTQSVRNLQRKDSDGSTSSSAKSTGNIDNNVHARRSNSESRNFVTAVKRNIVETANQTTKQNNKMIAFLSGLVAKFFSPLFQVFSKTVNVENKEEFKVLLNRQTTK